jgi:LysM domain
MPNYTVQQGDCMSSTSKQYGFQWQALWSHRQNSALKNLRKDPNVLFLGDIVFIPEKPVKQVSASVDATHTSKFLVVKAVLAPRASLGLPRSEQVGPMHKRAARLSRRNAASDNRFCSKPPDTDS